mgnify:FL=1
MKVIKTVVNKADINDKGYEKINSPKQPKEIDREGKQSREFWEDLKVEPTPENCYDYYDNVEDDGIELDFKEHFDYYQTTFYFRLDEFKYLDIELTEKETIAILALQDGSEYAIDEDHIEQLEQDLMGNPKTI